MLQVRGSNVFKIYFEKTFEIFEALMNITF